MDAFSLAKENFAYAAALRRHFHENPECGPAEQVNTMAYIEAELDKLGLRHVRAPGAGIFAFLDGPAGGKTLLLRADMDALPIEEAPCNLKQKKLCCSKTPGVMHGCGHDAHTAMLLAEAKILAGARGTLQGSVIFLFEQGEEGCFGIEAVCRFLCQQRLSPDGCYAAHVRWDIPVGKIACSADVAMAGFQAFTLRLHGAGGHGSRPDLARSPIDCFYQIYGAMQMLRMNRIRPDTGLTWSVGMLRAGSFDNVIPDELECGGTIRMFETESGAEFWKDFRAVVDHACALCGCTASLSRRMYLLPTRSDAACLARFQHTTAEALGPGALLPCAPWMASESFSYLSNMYPSVFAFVGIQNDALGSGANHHTPQFDLDEACLVPGVAAAVSYAVSFLAAPPDVSAFRPVCPDLGALQKMLHEA